MSRAGFIAAFLFLTLAAVAHAAVDARYAGWGSGPVKWLMTEEEQGAWRRISSDDQARQFIALFWARRDPTPGTPVNEFRDEFDRRVAGADATVSCPGLPGSSTEPGRVYILLGPPATIHLPERSTSAGLTTPFLYGYFAYRKSRGRVQGHVMFNGSGDGRYVLSPQGGIFGALARAVSRAIVSPDLTAVPSWTPTPPAWARFQITLLTAFKEGHELERQMLPAGVSRAVEDVRTILPYSRYDFVDSIAFSGSSNEPVNATMRGPVGKPYSVSLRFSASPEKADVSSFRVTRQDGSEIVSSAFSIAPGETVSLGASRIGDGTVASLFFVTWLRE